MQGLNYVAKLFLINVLTNLSLLVGSILTRLLLILYSNTSLACLLQASNDVHCSWCNISVTDGTGYIRKISRITISSDLRWNVHIANICKRANSTLSFFQRNINISNPKVKENAYKALERPTLGCCWSCIATLALLVFYGLLMMSTVHSWRNISVTDDWSVSYDIWFFYISCCPLFVPFQGYVRWNVHIANICKRANSTLSFFQRNINISNPKVKENAYKALERPTTVGYASTLDPYQQNNRHTFHLKSDDIVTPRYFADVTCYSWPGVHAICSLS
jgi:hypothetical protein